MAIREPRLRHFRRRNMDGLPRGRLRRLSEWAAPEAADLSITELEVVEFLKLNTPGAVSAATVVGDLA